MLKRNAQEYKRRTGQGRRLQVLNERVADEGRDDAEQRNEEADEEGDQPTEERRLAAKRRRIAEEERDSVLGQDDGQQVGNRSFDFNLYA